MLKTLRIPRCNRCDRRVGGMHSGLLGANRTIGVWHGGDRNWALNERQRAHVRGVRVALGGLRSCYRGWPGVAKRWRELISHPKPYSTDSHPNTIAEGGLTRWRQVAAGSSGSASPVTWNGVSDTPGSDASTSDTEGPLCEPRVCRSPSTHPATTPPITCGGVPPAARPHPC
jgi:hypothetical protein